MLLEITLIKYRKIININYKKTERLTATTTDLGIWLNKKLVLYLEVLA